MDTCTKGCFIAKEVKKKAVIFKMSSRTRYGGRVLDEEVSPTDVISMV
jgi:hypothetical protein